MTRLRVDLAFEQVRTIVGDLDPALDPVGFARLQGGAGHEDPRSPEHLLAGYGEINHPAPKETLWLCTLFHRVSMWCWLTRHGDISGPACLLRDLEEMTRSGA